MPSLQFVVQVTVLACSAACPYRLLAMQTGNPGTTLRVTSNLVYLDVTVVDRRGKPVIDGLNRDDFALLENGKPQRIFSFDAPAGHEQATLSSNASPETTATIIVLDLLNTGFADSGNARDAIRQYLMLQDEQLSSQTELMVMSNTALHLAQPYTRNRNDLLAALRGVKAEEPYKLGASWADERLAQSIEALQQLALQSKGQPGRKNILWIGNGGPNIGLDPSDPSFDRHVAFFAHTTTNMLVDERMSLFLIVPGGVRGPGNPDILRLQSGIVPRESELENDDPFAKTVNFGLFIKGTGGRYFGRRNDVDQAMVEAQEMGSRFYTLTYQPHDVEKDGKYRRIDVRVRNPKLRALTKTGYYAPEPSWKLDMVHIQGDPSFEIDQAAQSGFLIDSLGMSLAKVERHPDSQTVEASVLLKSTHLRWQASEDGRSICDITIEAVSLSKKRDILASRTRLLTIVSDSQNPTRLLASETPVSFIVPTPPQTEEVRLIILAQDGGQIGTLQLSLEALRNAPATPSPTPQLQLRPEIKALPN